MSPPATIVHVLAALNAPPVVASCALSGQSPVLLTRSTANSDFPPQLRARTPGSPCAARADARGRAYGRALEFDENGPNRTEAPSASRTSPTTIATGACLTVRDCDTTTLPALDREGPARPLSAHRA